MSQSMNPIFSVIIPLYNKRAHIIRTIESAMSQSFKDFEIVIVDDGSTDGGANLIQKECQQLLSPTGKVRLIRQSNAGVSAARNKGVMEATGDVMAFLDADDTWEPHFLEEVYGLMGRFPEAESYATAYQYIVNGDRYVDPKVRFSAPVRKPRILHDYFEVGARGALPFSMSSFCIRKDLFNRIGWFPEGEAMGEDQDLFIRAALHSNIAYSPSVSSFYHHDAENRACEHLIPVSECGFASRLRDYALKHVNQDKQKPLLDYVAAHLLHIVSLNVRISRYDVASRLLADPDCKRQTLRYAWWKFRCAFASLAEFSLNRERASV